MGLFDKFKKKNKDFEHIENKSKLPTEIPVEAALNYPKTLSMDVLRRIKKETEIPCVAIKLTDTKPSVFESKVGGIGYVPHDGNFPADSKGNQLRLLAQIECEKIKLDEFPKQGLLQFWIMNDDVYGADFDNNAKQDTFRIVYHETVDKSVSESEIKSKIIPNEYEKNNDDCMPMDGEYGLDFSESTNFMTENDFRFDKEFCKRYNAMNPLKTIDSYDDLDFDLEEFEDYESYLEYDNGHKIGGYPYFTQYDPRDDDKYDFLLLQLDSDFGADNDKLMWEDSGVCNFFINSGNLKRLDFSDVVYNWDCC